MTRLGSAHITRLAIAAMVLSVSMHTGGAQAAGSKPPVKVKSSVSTSPVVGTLWSATKHAILLARPGSKTITHIKLNARTEYVVKGKRSAKPPTFTAGLQLSVLATQSKGAYIAQVVIVGPSAGTAQSPVIPSPPLASGTAPPGPISLTGAVTLTSALSVTVQMSRATETIKLTSATRYVVRGKGSLYKPTLHAGEKVRIVAVQSNGMLVAQTLTVT